MSLKEKIIELEARIAKLEMQAILAPSTGSTRSGEMSLKSWCYEEARRCKVVPNAILMRLRRGNYPNIKIRRVNQRMVFVSTTPS